MNVLVEDLGNGAIRETPTNAPAVETNNARAEQVGPFRQDNLGTSQAATALKLGALDATAPIGLRAAIPGKIVGIVAESNADLTAGTATFQATVNTTASGTTAVLSDTVQSKVQALDTPVPFVAGDVLGIKLSSDGSLAPTTADMAAYLLVQWSPA